MVTLTSRSHRRHRHRVPATVTIQCARAAGKSEVESFGTASTSTSSLPSVVTEETAPGSPAPAAPSPAEGNIQSKLDFFFSTLELGCLSVVRSVPSCARTPPRTSKAPKAHESAPGGEGSPARHRGTRGNGDGSGSENSLVAENTDGRRGGAGADAEDGACLPPSFFACGCREAKQRSKAKPVARCRSLGTHLHADAEERRQEFRTTRAELERRRSGTEGPAVREDVQSGGDSSDDGDGIRSQIRAAHSLAGGEAHEDDEEEGAASGPNGKRAGYFLSAAFSCAGRGRPGRDRDLRQIEGEEQAFLRLEAVKERHADDPFVWQMATAKQCLMAQRQRALLERYAKGEDDVAHRDYYRSLGTVLQGDVKSRRAELQRLRELLQTVSAEWRDTAGARGGGAGSSSENARFGGHGNDSDSRWNNYETRSWEEDGASLADDSLGDEEEGLLDAVQIFTSYTTEKFRAIRKIGRRGLWRVMME